MNADGRMNKKIDGDGCREIRVYTSKNFGAGYLAEKFDVSTPTIYYHASGRCNHDLDIGPQTSGLTYDDLDEVAAILRDADDPVLTTGEVAERLTHDYADTNTVKTRLDRLVEAGRADCKRVTKAYVWWAM